MNYIGEINSFYDRLETNPLSTSAIALWFALMAIANKANWIDTFAVAISVLEVKTSLKKKSIERARNELKQKGFIEWRSRSGNQSAEYSLLSLCVKNNPQSVSQPVPQCVSQSVPQPVAINKLNYTKQSIHINDEEKILPELLFKTLEQMLSGRSYLEMLCMNNKINIDQMQEYIKLFFVELASRGETHKDLQDAKYHFSNWLRMELKRKKNENTRRNNTQGKVNFNSEGDINEKARTYTDLVNTLDLS